jgi:hypothetical protein
LHIPRSISTGQYERWSAVRTPLWSSPGQLFGTPSTIKHDTAKNQKAYQLDLRATAFAQKAIVSDFSIIATVGACPALNGVTSPGDLRANFGDQFCGKSISRVGLSGFRGLLVYSNHA